MSSMSFKKLFFISLCVPSIIFGMEEGESDLKKPKIDEQEMVQEYVEMSIGEVIECWALQTSWYISNLDAAGVRAQLAHSDAALLSNDKREHFLTKANQIAQEFITLAQIGQRMAQEVAQRDLMQRLTIHQEDAKQATQIKNLFYAFKFFKQFKFPQVFFSPRPYTNDPRPSLDKILEVLIINENASICACCFHITLYNVAQHLVDQKEQGVVVDVLTNQKQGENVPLQAIKLLLRNGIPVAAPRNKSYETNHHKFLVFGSNVLKKPLVWAGSYNATGHSNQNSWEDASILDDEAYVQSFQERFNEIKEASELITEDEMNAIVSNPSHHSLHNNNVPEEER